MKITKENIEALDLSPLWEKLPDGEDIRDWWAPCYKMFAALSQQLSGKRVLELGTRLGQSALAFGYNKEAFVVTYDIWNWGQLTHYKEPNVKFKVGDALDLPDEEYLGADLIYLDVDPHDGIKEIGLYKRLVEMGFGGMMICDDIFHLAAPHFQAMKVLFWDKATRPKLVFPDWAGHSTGMGVIFFGDERIEFED